MIYFFKILIKKIYTIIFIKKITKNYPKWEFLKKKKVDINIGPEKNILIAPCVGGNKISLIIETLIAYSLNFKNNNIEFLLCDQNLPACTQATYINFKKINEFIKYGPIKSCSYCWYSGNHMLKKTNFHINLFSENLKKQDKEQIKKILNTTNKEFIKNFEINKISIGEHAYAGALRFLTKPSIDYSDLEETQILTRYFESALKAFFISKNLFEKKKFDILLINHGYYSPQGIVFEVAKKYNIQVISWFLSDRKKTIILNHDKPFHKDEIENSNEDWKKIILNNNQNNQINEYLASKRIGKNDWKFFQSQKKNIQSKNFSVRINNFKKDQFVALFTNVAWDAQILYKDNIFENMYAWVVETIDYFVKINKQLVVRIHPAEKTGGLPTKYRLSSYLEKKYKKLPENILIIDSDNDYSSYQLIDKCKFALVYSSSIANEIMMLKKSVIVAGEALIKNKGISYDPKNKKEYLDNINSLLKNSIIKKSRYLLARKYFFYYYFKKMIPIDIMTIEKDISTNVQIKTKDMEKIRSNQDRGLDIISKAILEKTDFIYELENKKK